MFCVDSHKAHNNPYLLTATDEPDSEPFVIDAEKKGNESRYAPSYRLPL